MEKKVIVVGRVEYPNNSRPHQQDFVQFAGGICRSIPAGTHASTPHHLKTLVYDLNNNDIMATFDEIELKPDSKVESLGDCRFKIDGRIIRFAIRKLTPRECFRLMDVDDKDIDTIQAAGISNSQQYKLAGNSIVVNCLYHLFRKMFIDTEPEYKRGDILQLF